MLIGQYIVTVYFTMIDTVHYTFSLLKNYYYLLLAVVLLHMFLAIGESNCERERFLRIVTEQ